METINKISDLTKSKLQIVLGNQYAMASIKIFLILYASQIAPKLPSLVQNTLQNTFVKIIGVALIAYLAEVDFQLAIILAVIFVLSTNVLSGRSIFESYKNIEYGSYHTDSSKYLNLLGGPAVIGNATLQESLSDNYPGCNKVTLKDLLALFDGDAMKLQQTVQNSISGLMRQLPDGSTPKHNLGVISRATGLPYNLELNDKNAPLIATMLLQYGYKVSDTCQAPN